MTLGEFLASQFISARDEIAIRFRNWLGPDARRNYPKWKWLAIFRIFDRRKDE